MNQLIAWIEGGKPFFEKVSRNPYLRAIRDGFIAAMPVILFSSIFLLVAGTTAKSLTDTFNRDLPKTNQINFLSTMMAAISGFLLLAADSLEGGLANGHMGTKGLLTAFLAAFITVHLYRLCNNFFSASLEL